MQDFEEIIRQKRLPNLGETVRSKKYGTLWRVIEKKEVWQKIEPDMKTGEARAIPAIHLTFWKLQEKVVPGVGRLMGFLYTIHDDSFEGNWEIVK